MRLTRSLAHSLTLLGASVSFGALAGCSTEVTTQVIGAADSSTNDATGGSGSDTTGGSDSTVGPGADVGERPDTSATEDTGAIPTGENKLCDGASAPGHPTGYPFTGLSTTPNTEKSTGKTYTFECTKCPNGYEAISGTYRRYVDENPTLPDPKDERETWTFEGNAFTNVLEAVDKKEFGGDGQKHTVTVKGYYFCPNPEALFGLDAVEYWNVVTVYTYVSEPGVFGIEEGAVDAAFLGFSIQDKGDDIAYASNLLWDPKGTWQTTDLYCKVGATIVGRLCEDPFAQ